MTGVQLSYLVMRDAQGDVIPITNIENPGGMQAINQRASNLMIEPKSGAVNKWYDESIIDTGVSEIVITFATSSAVMSYELFTANDNECRDPVSWRMGMFDSRGDHLYVSRVDNFVPPKERKRNFGVPFWATFPPMPPPPSPPPLPPMPPHPPRPPPQFPVAKQLSPPSPPPTTSLAGSAFTNGPLSGCKVFVDINDNLVHDPDEPVTTTNSEGGYHFYLLDSQIGHDLRLTPGSGSADEPRCEDVYTGLKHQMPLQSPSGSSAISALTNLAQMHLKATVANNTVVAANGGRRLAAITAKEAMEVIRARLNLKNVNFDVLAEVDLNGYDPYKSVSLGKDYCSGSGLIVRTSQTQALVMQLATVTSNAKLKAVHKGDIFAATALERDAALVSAGQSGFTELASVIHSHGFDALSQKGHLLNILKATMAAELVPNPMSIGLDVDDLDAIAQSMVNSYDHLEKGLPDCSPANLWQNDLLNLHNEARAKHCAPPLVWDAGLEATAAAHVGKTICPSSADHHSGTAEEGNVGENVAAKALGAGDSRAAVAALFDTWYADQVGGHRFGDAISAACTDGGMKYSLTRADADALGFVDVGGGIDGRVVVCVPASTSRSVELTQLLWKSHTRMGCALRSCSHGQTLVCQYRTSLTCTGSDCAGNVANKFRENVLPPSADGSGPCMQRAWTPIQDIAKRAFAANDYLPKQMEKLVQGTATKSAFVAATNAAKIKQESDAAAIPVLLPPAPPPPSPPHVSAPRPPPYPSLPALVVTKGSAISAGTGTDDWNSNTASWGVVLGVVFALLVFICAPIFFYRVSGGEPLSWFRVQLSHSNPRIRFLYMANESRQRIKSDIKLNKEAMERAIKQHPNAVIGLFHMRRDHKKFLATGEMAPKPPSRDVGYLQASMDSPTKRPKPAISAAAAEPAAATLGAGVGLALHPAAAAKAAAIRGDEPPESPRIDTELDTEFTESEDDRRRRIEWIKHYVRENDLQKAFDLGWDGKPFRVSTKNLLAKTSPTQASPAQSAPTPAQATPAQSEGDADQGAGAAMHRI